MNADDQRVGQVLGVARRRFLRDLEQRLAGPACRLVLQGPDADRIADALVLGWPRAIDVVARRVPFALMHALAARLGVSLEGSRRDKHRVLRDAWLAQSELVIVRNARRLDAESRLWLDSLAGLEGAGMLVVDHDAPPIAGYGLARVPRLDADAIAEWCTRPEVVRRLVDASDGSAQALSRWLVGGRAPVDPELTKAADWIAAADGLDPETLYAVCSTRASDSEWAQVGVRRVRGELRSSMTASDETRGRWAEWAWAEGRTLDAMRAWRDTEQAEHHLDEALARLADAPACAAALLAKAEPTPARLRQRVELLRTIGRWGDAHDAARTWHQLAPSDDSAFELAWLATHTGRASDAELRDEPSPRWGALRAEVAFQRGELERAEDETRTVLDGSDSDRESRLSAMQTWAKLAVGDDQESLRRYDAYLAEADGDARHSSYATSGRAVALIRMRRLDEAVGALQLGAELAERADDAKAHALAHHNLGVALHLQDRYTDARASYETALRWLRALSHASSMARCAYNLGELYQQLGAHERALKMGELGAQLAATSATPASRAEGAILRGRALLALERLDAANAALQSVRDLVPLLDTSRRAGLTILRAQLDTAAGRAERALERLGTIDSGLELPTARRAELEVARARALRAYHGPLGRELETAERALRFARDSGSRHWVLQALRVLADALRSRGRSSAAILEQAHLIERDLARGVPADLVGAWEQRNRTAPVSADIVGRSARLHEALELARRVAPTRCTVLLRGESGTGKELLAEAIHRASGRRTKPLIRVSCAALVESLLLSELFGHERGAFTGATERRQGRFELAHGGTLFLDEVGELSPTVQAALLRVLQDRTFERVGGTEAITVDVRVVAATHRDLEAMVREGTFRADLYYRLNEVGVELPPLRERPDDVPLLVEHILRRLGHEQGIEPKAVSPAAMQRLQRFDWPGNVRQLENVVQSAAIFAMGPVLEPSDFSLPRESEPDVGKTDDYARLARGEISLRDLKKELERQCVARALADCEGNITKAAELLGMKRPRVSQLVKEYGLRDEPDAWKETV